MFTDSPAEEETVPEAAAPAETAAEPTASAPAVQKSITPIAWITALLAGLSALPILLFFKKKREHQENEAG